MMHDWYDGWAWWWMIPMMVIMVAVLVGGVWVVVRAGLPPGSTARPQVAPTPDEILAQRLAAGEIDAAQYHEPLEALDGRARQSG